MASFNPFRFLAVLGLIMLCHSLAAQRTYDMVVLKDSTRYYGQVIAFDTDGHLTIITTNRQYYVIDMSRVARVARVLNAGPPRTKLPYNVKKKPGYFNECEMGLNMGARVDPWSEYVAVAGFSLLIVNGYRWNQFLQAGIGMGIEVYERFPFSPFFLKVGGNVVEGPVSPVYWAELGYTLAWAEIDTKGGLLMGLGSGLRFNSRGNGSFQVGFGYRLHQATVGFTTWDPWGNPVTEQRRYQFNRVCMRLGVAF
jgi:hypothetical protein